MFIFINLELEIEQKDKVMHINNIFPFVRKSRDHCDVTDQSNKTHQPVKCTTDLGTMKYNYLHCRGYAQINGTAEENYYFLDFIFRVKKIKYVTIVLVLNFL